MKNIYYWHFIAFLYVIHRIKVLTMMEAFAKDTQGLDILTGQFS